MEQNPKHRNRTTWTKEYYERNKEVISLKNKARYVVNREKRKEYSHEYYNSHKSQVLERTKTRKENSYIHQMLINAKCRAKRKGIEFNITENDIKIPEFCPYLGIRLTPSLGKGPYLNSLPSLDRIDNTEGYIVGNVQVVSKLANAMKNTASKEELLAFAHGILKLYGEV